MCWVFAAANGLSLVAASGGHSGCGTWVTHCGDLYCRGALALKHVGFCNCGLFARGMWNLSEPGDQTHVL